MEEKPKAIDLFSGAGGLSRGLEDAGFKIIWAIDNEKKTKKTFDENHDIDMTTGDIRKEDFPDLDVEEGELDLVAGGPPCPTFSLVGRSKINSLEGRDVVEDDRHQLYVDFLRYVKHFNPKVFLMENVEGMKSAENEEGRPVVNVIKGQMEKLGYRVRVQVLNAANFGVPQHRNRIFFLGNRLDRKNPDLKRWRSHREPKTRDEKKIKYRNQPGDNRSSQKRLDEVTDIEKDTEFPTFRKDMERKKPWNTVADAILDLPPVSPEGKTPPKKATEYEIGPVSEYQEWARDIPEDEEWDEMSLHNHECRGHNMRDLTLYKLLGEGVSWIIGDIPEEHQPYRSDIFPDKLKKQNPREPSSTVVAHLYKDGHMFIHPREARSITVREAARLQSFRDSFKFPVNRTHGFKQVGNAVPPLLAQAIGTAIREELLD